jgi:phosphoenolpyruvate synthase/pyruvate phosphate dikinase
MARFVKKLQEMTAPDFQETGGKAANLGEMARNGLNVPPAFCITAGSLDYVLDQGGARSKIEAIAAKLDYDDYDRIESSTAEIRRIISACPIPVDLAGEIRTNLAELKDKSGREPFVAVRSSVAVRDSTISSFPGMMDTYHFLKGEAQIVDFVRQCWASLWTARAALRRHQLSIEHRKGIIAPIVQRMVNAEVAGVMFTANPISGSRAEIVIESNWGLGESLVSGESINDFFILAKESAGNGTVTVKERRIQQKNIMVTIDREKGVGRKKYDVPEEMAKKETLQDAQLAELARTGLRIEALFQYPQDIEWAYEEGELFLLQSRKVKGLAD